MTFLATYSTRMETTRMMARMQMLLVQIDRFICPAKYGLNVFTAPGNVGKLEPVELGVSDVLNLPSK